MRRIEGECSSGWTEVMKETVRSAAMFETLAGLHLPGLAATGLIPADQESSEQTERVFTGLQHMSAGEGSAFLRFAELQRTSLRTLQILRRGGGAGAPPPRLL